MWQQLWSFLRCSCFSHLSSPSWFTLCLPTIVKSTTRKSPIILGRQLTCAESSESPEYEINIYSKPIIRLVLSSWTNAEEKKTFVSHSTTQLQHVCLSDVFHITEARRNNVNDLNHNNPRSYFHCSKLYPKTVSRSKWTAKISTTNGQRIVYCFMNDSGDRWQARYDVNRLLCSKVSPWCVPRCFPQFFRQL